MRRRIAGVNMTIVVYAIKFDGGKLSLSQNHDYGDRILELYEGLPASRVRCVAQLTEISLQGIRDGRALLWVKHSDGFTIIEQYDPVCYWARKISAGVVSVPLGEHRDIVVRWDNEDWLYRLTCTKC